MRQFELAKLLKLAGNPGLKLRVILVSFDFFLADHLTIGLKHRKQSLSRPDIDPQIHILRVYIKSWVYNGVITPYNKGNLLYKRNYQWSVRLSETKVP
jgi:hypothetical protein